MNKIVAALLAVLVAAPAWADGVIIKGNTTFDANYPEAYSGQSGSPAGFTVGGLASDPNAGLELKAKGSGVVSIPSPATFGSTITQTTAGPEAFLQYYTGGPLNWPTTTNGELNYLNATIDTTLGAPPNGFQQFYLDTILQGVVADPYEMNSLHLNTTVAPGATLNGSAHQSEARFDIYGTLSNTENTAKYFYVNNYSSGTINDVEGIKGSLNNYNTAAHSISVYSVVDCKAMGGGGSLPDFDYCVDNENPDGMVMNSGHYMTSNAQGNVPTVASCGTGCTLDATAQDTMGTVTEGASATGFVLTFGRSFLYDGNDWSPHCVVSSPNGAPFTGYSVTNASLTVTNASASGNKYTYLCMGAR